LLSGGRHEMKRAGTCTCRYCGAAFTPDPRNAGRQKYCAAVACKAASKRASQAKWQAAPANQDYHRGPEAVARVQAWRLAHPGYSRRPSKQRVAPAPLSETFASDVTPLPDASATLMPAPIQISCNAPAPAEISAGAALQDLCTAQPIVLIGLIAHLWDSPLQDVIAPAVARLYQLGLDIQGGHHDAR